MTLQTVLVIDDDKTVRTAARMRLEPLGFIVFEASHGARSLDILRQHNVDAILLDIGLPDGDASQIIGLIKNITSAPLLIISGQSTVEKRIACFEAGADDFVIKPIEFNELSARLCAHLRRAAQLHANHNIRAPQKHACTKIRFGDWTLDRVRYQVFDKKNNLCYFTAREFQILDTLIKNKNRVLRREELCEAIRQDHYIPTPRAIDIKITRIRKKIGDCADDPQIIKTVRGIGYLFDTDIMMLDDEIAS